MFIDRILTNQIANRPHCRLSTIKEWLLNSQVILANNVAAYFMKAEEPWKLDDFPNVAPPFPFMFLEWPAAKPADVSRKAEGILLKNIGCLIASKMEGTSTPWKWSCASVIFLESTTREIAIPAIFYWLVLSDGKAYFPDGRIGVNTFPPYQNFAADLMYELPIAWLTLSFMHCKNVEFVSVPPNPKASRVRARKGRRPFMTYKILKIHPMTKILDTEGRAKEVGLKKALHICRGHFKDYREGPGLFGKFHGVWWWDMHTAGSIDEGIALKDYLVKPE